MSSSGLRLAELLQHPIVVAIATIFLSALGARIWHLFKARITVQSPLERELSRQGACLDRVVPTLNEVVLIQRPQLDLLIALGEAAQGENNGNVRIATNRAKKRRTKFTEYLEAQALIKIEDDDA